MEMAGVDFLSFPFLLHLNVVGTDAQREQKEVRV